MVSEGAGGQDDGGTVEDGVGTLKVTWRGEGDTGLEAGREAGSAGSADEDTG